VQAQAGAAEAYVQLEAAVKAQHQAEAVAADATDRAAADTAAAAAAQAAAANAEERTRVAEARLATLQTTVASGDIAVGSGSAAHTSSAEVNARHDAHCSHIHQNTSRLVSAAGGAQQTHSRSSGGAVLQHDTSQLARALRDAAARLQHDGLAARQTSRDQSSSSAGQVAALSAALDRAQALLCRCVG
jgi:trimeric autotransporter adhesin